jgi:hypothetical protein
VAAATPLRLLATADPPNPGRRRHGLAVPCPNTLVAVALVGLARRLGAPAHVSTHHGREHTHLTDPTAIATLLTAAGGPAAATAWQHDHPTPPDANTAGALRPGFAAANSHRARAATTRAAAQITHAFTTLGPDTIPAPLRQAGQLRLDQPRTVHRRARRADRPTTDQRHPRRPPPATAGPGQPDLNPARHMTISPQSTPVW